MINSLMSRMNEAQKLSIPQLQQAIQDGTLPPYVGIPLLQDKMKQEQMAKSAQQQPKELPIAQQVLQQAQQMDRGVEQLPSNLPEEGMADGGIVAFAEGDLVDDDNIEDYNEAIEDAEDQRIQAQNAETQLMAGEGIFALPNAGVGIKEKPSSKGITYKGDDYDAMLAKAAKDHKVPPEFLQHLANKETGGLSPEQRANARSKAGAIGIMQFMPATAKQYGIDPTDPAQSIDAAGRMSRDLLNHYKGDQRLAAMGYNWGQGNVDKWLSNGAKPEAVPKETRLYAQALPGAVALAEGGIVRLAEGGIAHFVEGGTPKSNVGNLLLEGSGINSIADYLSKDASNPSYLGEGPVDPELLQSQMQQFGNPVKQKQKTAPSPTISVAPSATPSATPSSSINTQASETPTTATSAPQDQYSDLMQQFKDNAEDRKKQKTIDGYMGLLTAGLGMMGGTSPYAMANIGQGALAGVKQYSDSRKQAAAEQASDLKNQISLMKAQESAKSNVMTQERLRQAANMQQLQLAQSNARNAAIKAMPATLMDETQKEQFIQKMIAQDPVVTALMKKNGLDVSAPTGGFDPSLFKVVKS